MQQNGSLPANSYAIVARQMGFAPRTVGDAYRDIKKRLERWQQEEPDHHTLPFPDHLFQNGRKNCGSEKFWDRQEVAEEIRRQPLKDRGNLRSLSAVIGVPRSTLHEFLTKEKLLKRYRASLKPVLTEWNRLVRLQYALEQIRMQQRSTRHGQLTFKDCFDVVHVDEKWFFIIKEGQKFILVFDEEPPNLYTRNKNNIEKVMFLCALARPRMVGNTYWDGKIGIWPIGHVGKAKRKSKHHNRGDPIWVNEKVDRIKYTEMMVDNVLPAIVSKWPPSLWNREGYKVRIQQDGAKSHIPEGDELWFETLTQLELEDKIDLYTQPPNSPDTNVNDLGFFASLQAKYYRHNPKSSFDIISMVQKSFDEYEARTLNRIWLSYQQCLNKIIEENGGNEYILGHMGKDKLERENRLPVSLAVTEKAQHHLHGQQPNIDYETTDEEEEDGVPLLSAIV